MSSDSPGPTALCLCHSVHFHTSGVPRDLMETLCYVLLQENVLCKIVFMWIKCGTLCNNVRFLQRDEDVGPRATVFNIRRNIFTKAEVVHLCFEY
jgi:hypothetical protein